MERYTKGGAFKERCNGNIPYAEIISFVSKVEDLCEKYHFADFEELKKWVDWTHEKSMENHFADLKQENQTLKNRWEKLKDWQTNWLNDLEEFEEDEQLSEHGLGRLNQLKVMAKKMEELEQGGEII